MPCEKFYIQRYLDAPPRFLLWTIDEAMFFIIPVIVGILINSSILGLIIAVFSFVYWKKFKGRGNRNLIKSLVYWYYPVQILGLKKIPDSSIRNYIG